MKKFLAVLLATAVMSCRSTITLSKQKVVYKDKAFHRIGDAQPVSLQEGQEVELLFSSRKIKVY